MKKLITVLVIVGAFTNFFNSLRADEPPNDPQQLRTVHFKKQDTLGLMGFASYEKSAEFLRPFGLKPKKVLGHALVFFAGIEMSGVEGCGCPPEFKEVTFAFTLDEKGNGSMQLAPAVGYSNHDQRVFSLRTKFGTLLNKAEVRFSMSKGALVKDSEGRKVIAFGSKIGLPRPFLRGEVDLDAFSLGGEFEGAEFGQVYYRQRAPVVNGFRPFIPGFDFIKVNHESEIGRLLNKIGFTPLMWQTSTQENGVAWIPEDQPSFD